MPNMFPTFSTSWILKWRPLPFIAWDSAEIIPALSKYNCLDGKTPAKFCRTREPWTKLTIPRSEFEHQCRRRNVSNDLSSSKSATKCEKRIRKISRTLSYGEDQSFDET